MMFGSGVKSMSLCWTGTNPSLTSPCNQSWQLCLMEVLFNWLPLSCLHLCPTVPRYSDEFSWGSIGPSFLQLIAQRLYPTWFNKRLFCGDELRPDGIRYPGCRWEHLLHLSLTTSFKPRCWGCCGTLCHSKLLWMSNWSSQHASVSTTISFPLWFKPCGF